MKKNNNTSAYLKQLVFDPVLNNSLVAKYLTNVRLVALVLILVLVTGIVSFATIPRRLNPEIAIPLISVTTLLPGAGPTDVESLVTKTLEDEIRGVDGVNTITSTSQENVSSIFVEFESNVDPDEAKDRIQNAVDEVVDLPDDAETPRVNKLDFEDQPILTFSIAGDTDTASLMVFSENLKESLKNNSKIDRVSVSGVENQEIQITVSPAKMEEFGISPLELQNQISSAVNAVPSGTVRTDNLSFSLSFDATADSIDSLRDLRLNNNGTSFRLSDVAVVSERSSPDQYSTYIASSDLETPVRRAVNFNVYKASSADIDEASKSAIEIVEETIARYDDQFELFMVTDTAELITDQFDDLTRSFASTIALVFLTLFIFLGIRQAIITSIAIPLTFLVSFTVMNMFGITVNFLSLFSLLLALGLLVDTAIVVITAVTAYFRSGKFTPNQTGLLVFRDYVGPVWATTITTVWAFLPLLLASGIIGEFIKSIPIVVSSTLIASACIALFITLPLMMIILKPSIPRRVKLLFQILISLAFLGLIFVLFQDSPLMPIILVFFVVFGVFLYRTKDLIVHSTRSYYRKRSPIRICIRCIGSWIDNGLIDFTRISRAYEVRIRNILESKRARRRTVFAVVVFSIFSYLLLPLGFVVNEFFPKSDSDWIYVGLELPSGTVAETSEQAGLEVLEILRDTQGANYVVQETAQAPPDVGAAAVGPNNILFTMSLAKEKQRARSSIEIADEVRNKTKHIRSGEVSVIEISGGPPAGADVQITLLGEDLGILDEKANETISFLETQEGVTNVKKSIIPGTSKIVFVPDLDSLNKYNISESFVGLSLRTFASGLTLDSVDFNGEETDIVFRNDPKVPYPELISNVTIPTQQGPIPLSELGTLKLTANPTQITREDGQRSISVTATVLVDYSTSQTNSALETFADTDLSLDGGYSWKTGGVNEENQNSVNSILQAMLLSSILIFGTVVVQLKSFRKALIIMLVIPLAISGVFIMFALTGTPLSFPALIGVLALFGIVVNNSIVMVDKINQNTDVGMPLTKSIYDAASSRVEPIFFSSLTTIIGLIPITLSDALWQGLGGAIIFGLSFSGTIMLFFIPVVYYMWFQGEKDPKRI